MGLRAILGIGGGQSREERHAQWESTPGVRSSKKPNILNRTLSKVKNVPEVAKAAVNSTLTPEIEYKEVSDGETVLIVGTKRGRVVYEERVDITYIHGQATLGVIERTIGQGGKPADAPNIPLSPLSHFSAYQAFMYPETAKKLSGEK